MAWDATGEEAGSTRWPRCRGQSGLRSASPALSQCAMAWFVDVLAAKVRQNLMDEPGLNQGKTTVRIIFLALLMLCHGAAFAQACPQGSVPVGGGNAGYAACVPMDQGTDAANTQPSGQWRKTWGALADGTNGTGGAVTGARSKRKAEADALNRCNERGGLNCKLTATYFNQCIAVASPEIDGGQNRWLSAETIEVATNPVLKDCSDFNQGRPCKVVYTDCTKPIFESH